MVAPRPRPRSGVHRLQPERPRSHHRGRLQRARQHPGDRLRAADLGGRPRRRAARPAEQRPDNPLAVLSGPTFAHEVAAGKPTAITLACESEAMGKLLMRLVATPAFRPYWSDDVVGAEIGGAVKNVLAIGCGVVDGAGLGLNARAALIARGFAEMQRYGLARGAQAETLAGLSGLGDLVLTCSSENSRNFSLGRGLGQGRAAVELMADRRTVAEGAFTAPVLLESAQALDVEMPIVAAVCALLDGSASVGQVVEALLSRPLKAER